ncbi:hypothetical protein WMY93_017152 [Mugilogobius chulae]|uniref:Uncharacterized protein n=1 Tax=Mugilogobius chulae TaxID=88201 RepID=A0AAW0NME3_9GOBI
MSGRIMALEEDKVTGEWKERRVCMGQTSTCSFPGLINHHHKFIISFAEDEAGELYFLATAYPSATSPYGTVFKFMDLPGKIKRAPPGKCKVKPQPVKVRGKNSPLYPRADRAGHQRKTNKTSSEKVNQNTHDDTTQSKIYNIDNYKSHYDHCSNTEAQMDLK